MTTDENTTTKTPRTEKELLWHTSEHGFHTVEKPDPSTFQSAEEKAKWCKYVPADFARQLETELNAANSERVRLREAHQQVLYGIGNTDNQMSEGNLQIIESIGSLVESALTQTTP